MTTNNFISRGRDWCRLRLGRGEETFLCALTLWIGIVACGYYNLLLYGATPGAVALLPEYWPAQLDLPTDPHRSTLIMVVHPHCSCSRASLSELAIIMGRFENTVSAYVLFVAPAPYDSPYEVHWVKSDLWESAQTIPGVHALIDYDGKRASLLGALTSGHTVLYGPNGRLLFGGGVTASRGHYGDNAGQAAITAILLGKRPELESTHVFGCHLVNTDREI